MKNPSIMLKLVRSQISFLNKVIKALLKRPKKLFFKTKMVTKFEESV